ncbi:urea carboxylase [Cellulomonas sp. PSBB021]|uniref:urea carboxylase n=1 Tax=Cellulomonas sp. PSBB021 TaxID=2003551 RepID=UPI000B8D3767|nr:urea carboxylase [Cellulomonas sp. PSBB021]ASR56390.1 urea carboxylase [Cellulomonas sp. PSBB021]
MVGTLLVANRGEIAVRIITTARRLGWRTVALCTSEDAAAPHVRLADDVVHLGADPHAYLDGGRVLDAARRSGATALHPGYGFLSEDAVFAADVESSAITLVGPTPGQVATFGDKFRARQAALAAGVPVLAASGLVTTADDALRAAEQIGYPVMLKAVAGGGGLGLRRCADAATLAAAVEEVRRVAAQRFGNPAMVVERLVTRARHVEVQAFGDGSGRVVTLGTRDCSLQRRHQKVLEEAPAPGLPDELHAQLRTWARDLLAAARYRSAGTVELVVDLDRGEAALLEVNARLQVEHTVTEEVTGVDLVGWMLLLAEGEDVLAAQPDDVPTRGHAVQARVYAEDPRRGGLPSTGTLTHVTLPPVRVDTWAEPGQRVTPHWDPLLAKVVVHGDDRAQAFARAAHALAGTRVDGVETNLPQLRAAVAHPRVLAGRVDTALLADVVDDEPWVEVLRAGDMTTVQDWPGRRGLWEVGVPPSGPMDDLSFRLGNRALGNDEGAPGLECTLTGPRLRFSHAATVCVTGAPAPVRVDGRTVPQWEPVEVPPGGVLDVGAPSGAGLRTYVLLAGGLDVPRYLGSASTFTLGGFGGTTGRALVVGDVLRPATLADPSPDRAPVPAELRPRFTHAWRLAVQEGPHPAPDFLTREDMATLLDATWRVQAHANRTGVRLSGPRLRWARQDGGEAGLHPSNVHDTPYSVGALNISGDTPILLGPDGPSLGGFACPVTVVSGHRWKLGQIRPGDTVRLDAVPTRTAERLRADERLRAAALLPPGVATGPDGDDGVLAVVPGDANDTVGRPRVRYLRGGDDNVLVEYGPPVLDLGLRVRVHALAEALRARVRGGLVGVVDVTPGVRSLHVHVDPDALPVRTLVGVLVELEHALPHTDDLVVPSRRVHLPLSFDDPVVGAAVGRYVAGVRPHAPWLPSNAEFVRRVNGLDSVDDVLATMLAAEYLVLGLGDVYLGAPLAVPLDPRHRLLTTKYNPARTWTAEGTVGLGGQYLCVYGMDSPGGYQLVGRTVPVWSSYAQHGAFEPGVSWLLRFFDRIVWHAVTPEELQGWREDLASGRRTLEVEDGWFSAREHRESLARDAAEIAAVTARRAQAFAAERAAWAAAGELDAPDEAATAPTVRAATRTAPPGCVLVEAPMVGAVWRVEAQVGERVRAGDALVALEAMKLELAVPVPVDGRLVEVLVEPGQQVAPGEALAVVAVGP